MSAPPTAGKYDECGECNHYPAYHRDINSKPRCLAWDPDQKSTKCACKGWQPPKVKKPQPA